MPGRKYSVANTNYRYGFNGKENDNDIEISAQDYGMRIYDGRLGRFLSVDPITKKYPELTPYQFASNTPIFGIDRDGKELLGNDWLFNAFVDWISGDPIGVKSMRDGFEEKAAIQTGQMSYDNGKVTPEIKNTLDHVNNIDANIKIAKGTAKLVTFNIKTSFDVMSSIVPLGEGAEIAIQGIKELSRARLAVKIYSKFGITGERLASHLKYYDFDKSVFTKPLEEGTELIQYQLKGAKGTGDYYTLPNTKPEEIGLDPKDIEKVFSVKLDRKVEGNLISSHKKGEALYYDASRTSEGGGTQIFNPEIKNNATITDITPK